MDSQTTGKKRTIPEGSDTSGVGGPSGLVPARPSSSSCIGLPQVLPAGTCEELATADSDRMFILSRSESQVSASSSCTMEVDRENRKRNRKAMSKEETEQGFQNEEQEEEDEFLAKRRVKIRARNRITSDNEEASCVQDDAPKKVSTMIDPVTISDYEDADCYAVLHPAKKDRIGDKEGVGVCEGNVNQASKKEFGVTMKRKRGRPRKDRRKKIGMDELGVHEIEDSENSEGYDVLSAPEMAATAIEYLEEADEIRIKCKNIKGDLSGIMKRRIHNAKEIIKGLAKTVSQVPIRKEGGEMDDEACFLRMENKELQARLKEKEKNCLQKEKEIQLLRGEIKELSEQMKKIKEEVLAIKRGKNKEVHSQTKNQEIGSTLRSSRKIGRIERTIEAISRGEDTSVADDSEVVDMEYLLEATNEWPTLNESRESHTSKRPSPIRDGRNSDKTISTLTGRNPHLERQQQGSVDSTIRKALEESLQDIKETRDRIRKKGNLSQDKEETPQPQRTPQAVRSRRTDIKVLSNVQLMGPRATVEDKQEKEMYVETKGWTQQMSRKDRRKEKKLQKQEGKDSTSKKNTGRRPPRTAAITIRIKDEDKDKTSYANILKKARDNIPLDKIGVGTTRIRKTAAGNVLIEIPGSTKNEDADRLAEELHRVLDGEAVIARPIVRGELRLFGLDDSINKEEIQEIISTQGKCKKEEVKVGDIKPMRSGLGMVWLQCPLTAAITLSKLGKIRIGWSMIKIELLKAREKQCFKCWKFGHLKYTCQANIDRSMCCYRCGIEGHRVRECTQNAQCVICKELKKDSNHRMGSIVCLNNRKTSLTSIPSKPAEKASMEKKDAMEDMDYISNNKDE